MNSSIGKYIIGLGVILVIVGGIIWLFGSRLGWLGHLPGDIRMEGEQFSFYFPITTMILISIVLSAVFTLVARIFGK